MFPWFRDTGFTLESEVILAVGNSGDVVRLGRL